MNAPNPRGRRRRALRPAFEPVEPRELPSGLMAVLPGLLARATTPQAGPAQPLTGQPTPHELRREAFAAHFKTEYSVGPGRFTDETQRIFFEGGGGNSNAFRHGNLLMALTTRTDGTIVGTASLIVKNISNTGNLLALDLQADPGSTIRGLPTRFTWTVNSASGGTFSGATGSGTGKIIYMPSGHLPQRATGAGNDGVVFQGLINTTGTTYVLRY